MMTTIHDINIDWISGMMVGIEFAFKDDFDDLPNAVFGVSVDLGIIRITYVMLEYPNGMA